MSRNSSYSLRSRNSSNNYEHPPEKRQKLLSPSNSSADLATNTQSIENASSVVYLGNIPPDWNEQIISSVVAGSGDIVDIRPTSGRGKNFCFIEYSSPSEASKALRLLGEITLGPKRKFRVELSKEGLRTSGRMDRPILELNRSFLPYYVQLPLEMKGSSNDSIPALTIKDEPTNLPPPQQQQHIQHIQQPQNSQLLANSTTSVKIPELFSKASSQLPVFNPLAFKADDKIAENLQSIPPPHLIELISTLKNLISVDMNSARKVFDLPNVPVNVVQALVLMGFVDLNTINAAISGATAQNSSSYQPMNNQSQQQQQQQQLPSQNIQIQPLQQQINPSWSHFPPHTVQKLQKLSQQDATVITQVLLLDQNVINGFPEQQRTTVESIRKEYFLLT